MTKLHLCLARLAEVTGGHPLSSLGFWLLNTTGIIQDLGEQPASNEPMLS